MSRVAIIRTRTMLENTRAVFVRNEQAYAEGGFAYVNPTPEDANRTQHEAAVRAQYPDGEILSHNTTHGGLRYWRVRLAD